MKILSKPAKQSDLQITGRCKKRTVLFCSQAWGAVQPKSAEYYH